MIQSVLLFLKGMAMGAADVVPGVSGGTIALVTGIYDRLLMAIKSVGLDTFVALRRGGIALAWKQIDGQFLMTLLLGILTSVFLLAKVIHHLLDVQPVLVWSFFFGLVLASSIYVGARVNQWNARIIGMLVLGVAVAAFIGTSTPTSIAVLPITLFLAGALAICAMILPGISGSFILLLMGMYGPVIEAVKSFNIVNLLIFALGCVVGILAFSRVLSYLLQRYHDAMLALLTGFMVGALVKIWPWKIVMSFNISASGKKTPLIEDLVLPSAYIGDPQIGLACALIITGAGVIFLFDRVGKMAKKTNF